MLLSMLSEISQNRIGSKLLSFWIDLAARDAENMLSPTYRIAALTLMTEIWLRFKINQ
jgi:hypothetical protein